MRTIYGNLVWSLLAGVCFFMVGYGAVSPFPADKLLRDTVSPWFYGFWVGWMALGIFIIYLAILWNDKQP